MSCSVAHAAAVLGERWVILILREAYDGATRFEEFTRRLGIAPNILRPGCRP
ncbi:helix-turn-helix transcriptional regulator (plasmid) [Cupriavidus sp. KK10]|jgi:DNA-binding HxlR family transcriptional regulator|uniref:winged helix-turn-helix transcriptional regulator n=1 Tax=Cupriavidus sp. KK10 TaxID=1478019 RepID=UPI001BA81A14|nr:helix-turn-helix transcriptional regulator [Cupriavidus sp. KK10]